MKDDNSSYDLEQALTPEPVTPAQAKEASQTNDASLWEDNDRRIPWERDLLTLFVRNQLQVALALPILAVLLTFTTLVWISWAAAGTWLAAILAGQGMQIYFCKLYQKTRRTNGTLRDWIGMLSASEFFYAACWSLPLYAFWSANNDLQHILLIAILMAVAALRVMIAANFMPIVIAGSAFITFSIAIRCVVEGTPLYIALGAMAIIAEIFLVQLSRRLQHTAKDMLIFKSQREQLISQLKSAKDQADKARVKAEEANRSKSRFLATMSHELRTPLNAILGFSEILSNEMMGPHAVQAYKDYSSDIHHSGNYLLTLINDILDLSRIEAGRHELQREQVDVVEEAQSSIKMVAFKAREKNQKVKVSFPHIPIRVRGDKRAVRQIWLNLISNAVKFTPEGGLISLKVERRQDGAVTISVSDNGPGIPREEVHQVFAAFGRGSRATRKAVDGAGLGLAIVYGLVKLHSAELDIRSAPGKGTLMMVTFPASQVISSAADQLLLDPDSLSESQRQLISATA